jgi:transposase
LGSSRAEANTTAARFKTKQRRPRRTKRKKQEKLSGQEQEEKTTEKEKNIKSAVFGIIILPLRWSLYNPKNGSGMAAKRHKKRKIRVMCHVRSRFPICLPDGNTTRHDFSLRLLRFFAAINCFAGLNRRDAMDAERG